MSYVKIVIGEDGIFDEDDVVYVTTKKLVEKFEPAIDNAKTVFSGSGVVGYVKLKKKFFSGDELSFITSVLGDMQFNMTCEEDGVSILLGWY